MWPSTRTFSGPSELLLAGLKSRPTGLEGGAEIPTCGCPQGGTEVPPNGCTKVGLRSFALQGSKLCRIRALWPPRAVEPCYLGSTVRPASLLLLVALASTTGLGAQAPDP